MRVAQSLRIQTAGLSEGIHQFHFETTATELALGDGFSGQVSVDADLDKAGNQILLTARIKTVSSAVCDRCVTPFAAELSPSYQMYYVWKGQEAERFDPSEVQVIAPGRSVISLDDDVRQTILLSVPLKLLCREDCKGLCPQCGKNLNEGPCGCHEMQSDMQGDRLRPAANSDESID